ncbi:putative DNA binding domain [Pseudocohnilembus persalinus]|uniref:phenylalanine--tRNA ligase n=1 Tax=Pseudocohnilembus persalinus TaxID=266149 RepID=A0A0V0QMG3_PSEPJ|nr:putative DNA binding domain [Pseudocohnilembus persalinus]|eukprot:KRX03405.1 putative DNA binding domain [Pseudocohnilembus persalinus]
MPKVAVPVNTFDKLLKQKYELKDLEQICFDYGMEVEIESEEDSVTKKITQKYVFETAANRPDLLCGEGIANALNVYLGLCEQPVYKYAEVQQKQKIVVKKNTDQVRPFVVAAILRDITFTQESYDSFIDLQTKLHFNHCRRRRLVAIGTHNLDTIEGPFVYDALKPEEIKFAPLNIENEMTGQEIMDHYEADKNYKEYVHIIKDSPVYPLITEQKRGIVLSLPPLINGNYSKMSKDTKNILIECTATDHTRAIQALNVIIASFSQYCSSPYVVEPVDIEYEANPERNETTPNLGVKSFDVSVVKVQKLGTFQTDADNIVKLLYKMQYTAEKVDEKTVRAHVPAFRTDILQECDIAEDVCIAHGYNKIEKVLPSTFTVGSQQLINKLSDLIRDEVAASGFQEGLNFALNNEADLTTKLCKENDPNMVKILNPRTADYTCGRTTLIPGCLKWLAYNKVNKLPIKIFELSDVILKDEKNQVGARNERRITALQYNLSSQLEIIQGLLDQIMIKLKIKNDPINGYSLQPVNSSTFFPERSASILYKGQEIGILGILHPNVLEQYGLENPVSLFEINLEPLFKDFAEND